MFRIPLIQPNTLVVERIDLSSTASNDPDAGGPLQPQNDVYRVPTFYENAGMRADTRMYLPAVRFPVQFEIMSFEELRMTFGGTAPVTKLVFIAHLQSLVPLGLQDAIKPRDKITAVEVLNKPGVLAYPLQQELFVYRVDPGSPGTGPTGADLRIIYTTNEPDLPQA